MLRFGGLSGAAVAGRPRWLRRGRMWVGVVVLACGVLLMVAAQPALASTNVDSVSCASAGDCSAVGNYYGYPSDSNSNGFLLTESSGVWASGMEATPPASAAENDVGLVSVSCASASNCTAVGELESFCGNHCLAATGGSW